MRQQSLLMRYTESERMNHWVIALFFVFAGLTGLAFFHPAFFFFAHLFGGGPWARILHPFFGLIMAVSFVGLFVRLWRENVMTPADKEWRAHTGDMLRGDKSKMPPVGKYNAGQKGVFWAMALSLAVLVVTGVMFWLPWFAAAFQSVALRDSVLLHSVASVVLSQATIVHVYAAIWVKGTVRAMTRGTVTESWAKQHHALWHKKMTEGK